MLVSDDLDKFLNIPRASERQKPSTPPTLWYGLCGYWTDDWAQLKDTSGDGSGIPCCPFCGAVGFVEEVASWWANVDAYEAGRGGDKTAHHGYRAQVEAAKGICPQSAK